MEHYFFECKFLLIVTTPHPVKRVPQKKIKTTEKKPCVNNSLRAMLPLKSVFAQKYTMGITINKPVKRNKKPTNIDAPRTHGERCSLEISLKNLPSISTMPIGVLSGVEMPASLNACSASFSSSVIN